MVVFCGNLSSGSGFFVLLLLFCEKQQQQTTINHRFYSTPEFSNKSGHLQERMTKRWYSNSDKHSRNDNTTVVDVVVVVVVVVGVVVCSLGLTVMKGCEK
jgi:hypothetical protein